MPSKLLIECMWKTLAEFTATPRTEAELAEYRRVQSVLDRLYPHTAQGITSAAPYDADRVPVRPEDAGSSRDLLGNQGAVHRPGDAGRAAR